MTDSLFTYVDQPLLKSEINPAGWIEQPTYIAWAIGPCFNALVGSSGVTVSGWETHQVDTGNRVDRKFIPSKNANRREWEGTIMGIAGVCEELPINSHVLIKVRQRELSEAYGHSFRKTNGKPMAGEEYWVRLLGVIRDKNLRVSVEFAPEDSIFESLRKDARNEGIKQFNQMGLESVLATVQPAKAKSQGKPPFEPVDGYIDQPSLIARKPRRARRKKPVDRK